MNKEIDFSTLEGAQLLQKSQNVESVTVQG